MHAAGVPLPALRSPAALAPGDLRLLAPVARRPEHAGARRSAPLLCVADGDKISRSGAPSFAKSRAVRLNNFLVVPNYWLRLANVAGEREVHALFTARRDQRGGRLCSSKLLPRTEEHAFCSNKDGLIWTCSPAGWGMERLL